MTGTSDASDYRRAARGGGASQGKRAMVRRSMSAGVLLIHNSLAGLVTLLDLLYGPGARLSTAARLNNGREGRPGALPRRQPRWSEFLWASCVTTPPVASRFLLPWLSPGETGESYVSRM